MHVLDESEEAIRGFLQATGLTRAELEEQRELDRQRPTSMPARELSPESAKKMGAFFEFEVLDDQEQKTEPQRRRTRRQSDDTTPDRPTGKPRP